jgi:hypothetical protein
LLHNDVGFLEAFVNITQSELEMIRQVRAWGRIIVVQEPSGTYTRVGEWGKALVQQWCALTHRFLGVAYRGQDFVLHLNQLQGFLGNVRTRRRYGGNGVSLIEHLIRRHNVVAQEAYVVDHAFGQVNDTAGGLRQVSRGDDGMDPWNFRSMTGINAFNTGMGVGTAQDLAMEQTR